MPSRLSKEDREFLAQYDPKSFTAPLATVDTVLFSYAEGQLYTLLVKRAAPPQRGRWGLPGGFVELASDQSLEAAAARIVTTKTSVMPPYLEQLGSWGGPERDPRGWSLTVCYTALIAQQACAPEVDSVAESRWLPFSEAQALRLAFDHQTLLSAARERLRQKALYSVVPAFALPEEFTLPELQQLHEVLIGKSLQKKSFRRRIEQAGLLEDTGHKRKESGRPATLYRALPAAADYTFVRNLEA